MPRAKLSFSKKRKGVRGRKPAEHIQEETSDGSEHGNASENVSETRPRPVVDKDESSSSKKIKLSRYDRFLGGENYDNEFENLNILSEQLYSSSLCKVCKKNGLQVRAAQHFGLAFHMEIFCSHCKFVNKFSSCKKVKISDKSSLFDVNIRLSYGLRSIGKGMAAGRMLCGIMNLPQPKILSYTMLLKDKAKKVMTDSMKAAVKEAVEENKILLEDSNEDGSERDLKAGFDGTWQRRGFRSLNGIVTCTSVDTGKVMDIEVLTKFCNCVDKELHKENCPANYQGSSGGMEVAGAMAIFGRSLAAYKVRYTEYLGDGDTNSFKTIADSQPYPDVEIKKLECIGHVQKRTGARVRNLKKKYKGKTLSDGQKLGGKNRLTDALIDQLQSYYSNAIRKNTHCLKAMRNAVWAIYFHKLATDEHPEMHNFCPKGKYTWCEFIKAKNSNTPFSHKNNVPEAIMLVIKPVFQALSHPDLLRKCLHGKTQNVNESLNNVIWSTVPKRDFVSIKTLQFGAVDAVSTFNDGNITKCLTLQEVGITPSKRTVEAMKTLDYERVRRAEVAITQFQRQARRKARNLKRKLEEEFDEEPAYNPGMH